MSTETSPVVPYKVLDFRSAVAQAREEVPNKAVTDIGRTILLLRTILFR